MILGMPRPQAPLLRRRWRVAVVAAAGLALAVAAGLLLPDAGLRWGVIRLFHGLGMADVSVSDADLSLFGGRMVVRRIEARPHSGAPFGLAALDLVMRWLPLFDRRVAVQSLTLDGLSIDIRREGGRLVVNGLPIPAAGGGGGTGWSFGADAVRLTASRVTVTDGATAFDLDIDALDIDGLHSWDPAAPVHIHLKGRLDGAPIAVTGTATPFAADPAFSLAVETDRLDLARPAAAAGFPGLAGRLSAQATVTGHLAADGLRLEADGSAALAQAALALGRVRLAAARLDWRGRVGTGPVQAVGTLTARQPALGVGDTTVTAESVAMVARRLDWSAAGASLAGNATITRLAAHDAAGDVRFDTLVLSAPLLDYRARGGRVTWQGGLTAETGRVAAAGITAALGHLAWQGRAQLALEGTPGPTLHLDGRIDSDGGTLDTGTIQAEQRHADAEGSLDVATTADGSPTVAATLAVAAAGLAVHEPAADRDLAVIDTLDAIDLRLTPGQPATVGRLEGHGLAALRGRTKGRPYRWRVQANGVRLDHVARATDGALSAGAVVVDGLLLRLTRTESGFVGLGPAKEEPATGDDDTPRLAAGRLTVGGNSRINFIDRSLDAPVRLTVSDLRLGVSGLDTAAPDHDSPFDVKARLGGSTVAASGTLRPFAAHLTGDLRARVAAFELPPLSPYAHEALGVRLQTGHVDGDVTVKADQGALDGKVDMTLSNLFVAQPDADAPIAKQAGASQTGMSVATVLDLLRDGDDNIQLTIPFSGNLADPQFDVSDAVAQAIGGALRATALTTLKVLFPVAALIEMAAGDDAMTLDPMTFPPGDDTLDDPGRARLATVADLLRHRPRLTLTVCGSASVAADWPVLLDRRQHDHSGVMDRLRRLMNLDGKPVSTAPDPGALGDLAQHRADAVKAWLADSGGIDAARLYSCRPTVEPTGSPQVTLQL